MFFQKGKQTIMKKALSLVLAILLVMALSVAASATVVNGKILNGTPVVDGELDDIYTQSASYTLDKDWVYAWGDGDIANSGDATAYFLWDSDYLYICVVAADSTPCSSVDQGWDNDAAEMWFLDEDLKCKIHAAADGNFFLGGDGDGAVAWEKGVDVSQHVAVQNDDGWVVECAFPMNDLAAGKTFGFALQVNDIYDNEKTSGVATGSQNPDAESLECVADTVVVAEPETEAPAAEAEVVDIAAAETTVVAPKTFDAGIIAAVAAIVSAAGYAVSKKH